MLRSMTAYGRAKAQIDGKAISVEVKSVNNRYLDLNIKLPRQYNFMEESVRMAVKESGISRGKLDIYISVTSLETKGTTVALDLPFAESYVEALYRLRDELKLKDDISTMRVASNRELFIFDTPEEDVEGDQSSILSVVKEALAAFCAMREAEGERLCRDISEKKAYLVSCVPQIKQLSKEDSQGYFAKLEGRLREVLDNYGVKADESRILTECAIFADKVAVDEETVRLESHFVAFDEMLESKEPVGRKLDFLIQEMNRETNTIGSKAADLRIARLVISMKNEIEKIREQVQNIE